MTATLASYHKRLALLRAKRDAVNDDIARVLDYIAKLEGMYAHAAAHPEEKVQDVTAVGYESR